MKFTILRYYKGTQERGYILGAVDDILQALDDNAMNLQSMSGSRFVGPFLSTVQEWEKSLSLISEVIAVKTRTIYSHCDAPHLQYNIIVRTKVYIGV